MRLRSDRHRATGIGRQPARLPLRSELLKVLEVRIHTLANPRSNRAIQLDHLNATESTFPGTEFRLSYILGETANGVT